MNCRLRRQQHKETLEMQVKVILCIAKYKIIALINQKIFFELYETIQKVDFQKLSSLIEYCEVIILYWYDLFLMVYLGIVFCKDSTLLPA